MSKTTKPENKDELRESIARKIEKEVEAEVSERLLQNRPYISRIRDYFIAIGVAVMTLGQFSEAVTLIEDGYNWVSSKITHSIEYELLSKVHAGNTQAYIEDLLGSAQVSRSVSDDVVANYYHTDKFLLTIFLQNNRVAAYTYISLRDDFKPATDSYEAQDWLLQDQVFSSFYAGPKKYMIDHSKTISYYIEQLDGGRAGLINENYLGKVTFGTTVKNQLLIDLNKTDISGTDDEILELQTKFRNNTYPNLYGSGTVSLNLIQKSLLTHAEFSNYFIE